MSFIQNFFTSRDNNANAATYVGQQDRLWWNPDTNALYVNTANTPGGTPVTLPSTANLVINTLTANSGNILGDLVVAGNISPAGNNKIGGIAPGPGVEISNTGLLTIDTAGLPLSFGDFTANVNILSMVNVDEDMILATSGNAEIQLIGNIGFYRPNGLPPDTANRYAQFNNDGQVTFVVSTVDTAGAMQIIGSSSGDAIAPGITGAMLHITGQLDIPCRTYYDGNGDYVAWVARRWNGNVAAPTQVLANDDVLRINSTAATDAGVGNVAMAQMRMTALENQTTTAQGSSITFTVTPVGSSANARVDVANVTVANGITATKFTTAGTVTATGNITGGNIATVGIITATGNITGGNVSAATFTGNLTGTATTATTATNLAAATSILAGTLTIDPANINKTSASTQTFTLTGLTTSHNIVITAGTALDYGVSIVSAWASALNTLSITFHNYSGAGVNLGSTDIQYFAWV
jgi:hypothetical protein